MKPEMLQLDFSEDTIMEVWREFEAENPGKTYRAMSSKEFADRMMKKVMASARIVEGGNA